MYGSWTCVLSVAILRVSKLYLALWDFYRVFLDRPHIRLLYFKSNHDNIELLIFHVQGLLHVYSLKTKLLLTVNEVLKGIKAFKICLKSSVFGSFLKLKEFLNPLLLCSKASCQHIDHRNSWFLTRCYKYFRQDMRHNLPKILIIGSSKLSYAKQQWFDFNQHPDRLRVKSNLVCLTSKNYSHLFKCSRACSVSSLLFKAWTEISMNSLSIFGISSKITI